MTPRKTPPLSVEISEATLSMSVARVTMRRIPAGHRPPPNRQELRDLPRCFEGTRMSAARPTVPSMDLKLLEGTGLETPEAGVPLLAHKEIHVHGSMPVSDLLLVRKNTLVVATTKLLHPHITVVVSCKWSTAMMMTTEEEFMEALAISGTFHRMQALALLALVR